MAEWFKAPVLKTDVRQRTVSSNLTTSANLNIDMFDHITISTKDFEKSVSFYENILLVLDIKKISEYNNEVTGFGIDRPVFWIGKSDSSHMPSTNIHIAFMAKNKEQVDAFYNIALRLGGKDNGAPGYREYHKGYYACFVLDLDGNNIEAVFRE